MLEVYSGRNRIFQSVTVTLRPLICILVSLTPAFGFCASSYPTRTQKPSATLPNLAFRYVIVNSYFLHNGRLVTVFMDHKSFSETNLRELFALLSKRFPKPDTLTVGVFTSLEQLPTPEEEDYAKAVPNAALAFLGEINKYPGASYRRLNGNEGFLYSMGEGQDEKTVIIAGKNPFK